MSTQTRRRWRHLVGLFALGATTACNGLLGNNGEVELAAPDGSADGAQVTAESGTGSNNVPDATSPVDTGDTGVVAPPPDSSPPADVFVAPDVVVPDACSGARNVCQGCGAITATNGALTTARPGDPCGVCGSGQTYCADANTLSCQGATANECGGCGTLAGTPNTACGSCSGTWTCATDKASVTCTGDHPKNACNGCDPLTPGVTTPCTSGVGSCTTSGEYACSGQNATACNAPAGPAPIGFGTSEWNGSWDRNCDGMIEYLPADADFLPYSATYPNDGPSWATSAGKICASAAYANSCGSGFSPWINYPAAVENSTYPYPGCGENYITFRCTNQAGTCVFTNSYCNGEAGYATDPKCTIRNDIPRQCE
jgi:hypothetical protein